MKLGYLDRNGKLYECHSYDHLDMAMKICKSFEHPIYELRTNLDCEDYIMDVGYVCLRARTVNFSNFTTRKYAEHFGAKFCNNFLTEAQREYLENLFKSNEWFNTDQMDVANEILEYDKMIKEAEFSAEKGEIVNPIYNKGELK